MHHRCLLQPVNKPAGRIAPVSAALVAARRDPRLARHHSPVVTSAPAVTSAVATPAPPVAIVAPAAPTATTAPLAAIAPNVFDIKPLERVTKRKNVITIDVRPDGEAARPNARDPRRRDPRLEKRDPRRVRPREERERRREEIRRAELERNRTDDKPEIERGPTPAYVDKMPDPKKISKMPPIPKISRPEAKRDGETAPPKRKRDGARRRRAREEPAPAVTSPDKKARKDAAEPELVAFKELRNYHKEHYMRRNRRTSDSPEPDAPPAHAPDAPSKTPLTVACEPTIVILDISGSVMWKIKCFLTLGVLYIEKNSTAYLYPSLVNSSSSFHFLVIY